MFPRANITRQPQNPDRYASTIPVYFCTRVPMQVHMAGLIIDLLLFRVSRSACLSIMVVHSSRSALTRQFQHLESCHAVSLSAPALIIQQKSFCNYKIWCPTDLEDLRRYLITFAVFVCKITEMQSRVSSVVNFKLVKSLYFRNTHGKSFAPFAFFDIVGTYLPAVFTFWVSAIIFVFSVSLAIPAPRAAITILCKCSIVHKEQFQFSMMIVGITRPWIGTFDVQVWEHAAYIWVYCFWEGKMRAVVIYKSFKFV